MKRSFALVFALVCVSAILAFSGCSARRGLVPQVTSPSYRIASNTAASFSKIYLADEAGNEITTYTPSGIETTPTVYGMTSPQAVAIDAQGKIFVVGQGPDEISSYTAGGVRTEPTIGGLHAPQALVIDAAGKLSGGFHHLIAQVEGRETADELFRLLDEDQ